MNKRLGNLLSSANSAAGKWPCPHAQKRLNTLVFKTNATLCYAEKNIDGAAEVIHIINYNSELSLMNMRICYFSHLCAKIYHKYETEK